MQKRSLFRIDYVPVELDPQFPIRGGEPFEQKDHPITFLHTHECLELGYCYSGSGIFIVGDKVLLFREGDISFINHTEPHLAQSVPGTSSQWTWVYFDPLRLIDLPGANLGRLDPAALAGPDFHNMISGQQHPEIARNVLRMIEELQSQQPGRRDCLCALCWELMTLIHRLAPAQGKHPKTHAQFDRLAPALQHVAGHYAEPVDIDFLAARCRMSAPHFRRLFSATIGRSPRAYWHDLRMRMAASLLRTTSRPILAISGDVGFETLSSFNRLFQSTFDMSPREWRKKAEGKTLT